MFHKFAVYNCSKIYTLLSKKKVKFMKVGLVPKILKTFNKICQEESDEIWNDNLSE